VNPLLSPQPSGTGSGSAASFCWKSSFSLSLGNKRFQNYLFSDVFLVLSFFLSYFSCLTFSLSHTHSVSFFLSSSFSLSAFFLFLMLLHFFSLLGCPPEWCHFWLTSSTTNLSLQTFEPRPRKTQGLGSLNLKSKSMWVVTLFYLLNGPLVHFHFSFHLFWILTHVLQSQFIIL